VQNHAILDGEGEPLFGEPGFDVFAEVEFDSETTLDRAAASPYYQDVILPDERNLLDASRRTFLMTRREVLSGRPQAALPKVALFLGRRAATVGQGATVSDRWLAEASGLAPRTCAVSANVVHRVGGAIALNVDVVLQHYFRRLDDAREWYVEAEQRWTDAPAGALRIVSGVITAEVEVVPRILMPASKEEERR